MKRINITLYDETFARLENLLVAENEKSMASLIRKLIDFAVLVKESASKSRDGGEQNDMDSMLVLLKKILTWSLETRFLARFMVGEMTTLEHEKRKEILNKYKEKSKDYVRGMLDNTVS